MTDIVGFLRARLDEDEAVARATIHDGKSGEWEFDYSVEETSGGALVPFYEIEFDSVAPALDSQHWFAGPDTMRHIARYDPARVLREVEAKRRIVDAHADHPMQPGFCRSCGMTNGPCETKRLLAAIDDDHPEYREEWKP